MDYMSMVMIFYFSNQERLIHIRGRVENCLEVCLMEDHKEETPLEILSFATSHYAIGMQLVVVCNYLGHVCNYKFNIV